MSSTSSTEKPTAFRKPAADVYTFLLVVSLLAIIVSCVFLYLYMADYQFKANKGGPAVLPRVSMSHTTGGAQTALLAYPWAAGEG